MVMGLIKRKASRAGWLLRYWVLDKYAEQARMVVLASAAMCLVLGGWWVVSDRAATRLAAALPGAEPATVQALAWWGYLIIMVVSAVVMWALAPKPEPAKPQEGKTPEVKDGKAVRRVYGTVWVDDSAILAWKNLDPEPIRKKGGKK